MNTIISFNVPLPKDPKFAPSMACRVYDKCFLGFDAALVGTFTIPVGQLMIDQKEEYEKNIAMLDEKIAALEKHLDGMAVEDYDADPVKEKQLDKELEDKSFRESQREQKKI